MLLSSLIKQWQADKKSGLLDPLPTIAKRIVLYPVFIFIRYAFAGLIYVMWDIDHMHAMLRSTR